MENNFMKYHVWEVELFNEDGWVKETRYYQVKKDHTDFDLTDIEGKRREAWYVGLSGLLEPEVPVITNENIIIKEEDGFDWYLPLKEIDRKYGTRMMQNKGYIQHGANKKIKNIYNHLGWPKEEVNISEFMQSSLLEEKIKEQNKLLPLRYQRKVSVPNKQLSKINKFIRELNLHNRAFTYDRLGEFKKKVLEEPECNFHY